MDSESNDNNDEKALLNKERFRSGWLDRFRYKPGDEDNDEDDAVAGKKNGDLYVENAVIEVIGDENQNDNTPVPTTPVVVIRSNRSKAAEFKTPSKEVIEQYRNTEDLTRLDEISLDNVLNCLVERFCSSQYYTYAGPVLLSLNPCSGNSKLLLDDLGSMKEYRSNLEDEGTTAARERLPPHVYSVGLRSLQNLVTINNGQVIVVSGDSGAGKTTCTQNLIRFLTEMNLDLATSNNNMIISSLEKKIYYATVILESFGNASTRVNPNSSRFGRLVELKYSDQNRIVGAEVKTYLLEKHRVSKCSSMERNFHIFYYLLKGTETERLKKICSDVDLSKAFEVFPVYLIEGIKTSDLQEFDGLCNAIDVFELTDEFRQVFGVIFAIMHLITVDFELEKDSEDEEEEDELYFGKSASEFTVVDPVPLGTAAGMLGIAEASLRDAFVARKITAGNLKRPSIFRKPCEKYSECDDRLQAFYTTLYDKVFSFVLFTLNSLLKSSQDRDQSHQASSYRAVFKDFSGESVEKKLSLLDLYGFENLEPNHLEQMCINYANERLQQVHVSALKNYFLEQAHLQASDIPFQEPSELNRVQSDLIQRIDELHSHVFTILNEECLSKRSRDDKDVFERFISASKTDKFISPGRLHEEECPFIIRHYATDVVYGMKGMLDKNKDYVPPEFAELFQSSKNSFVRCLFSNFNPQEDSTKTPKSNKNDKGKTILMRFKSSVDELVNHLTQEDQDLHFIRCIRPNMDLSEGSIYPEVVKNQLYSCGIVDVIRIAGNGYPIRVKHDKFLKEFPKTIRHFSGDNYENSNLRFVEAVFSFATTPIKVSNSMLFMNEKSWKGIRKFEAFLVHSSAKSIQRWWKAVVAEQLRTPILSLNLGNSSVDSTMWYTPSEKSSQYSLASAPIPGPFGDVSRFSENSIETLNLSCFDSSFSSTEETLREQVEPEAAPLLPKFRVNEPPKFKLYKGDGIISRNPVHTLPIKFYTKKTALGFSFKPPQRLAANGIQDALEDYGIIFE